MNSNLNFSAKIPYEAFGKFYINSTSETSLWFVKRRTYKIRTSPCENGKRIESNQLDYILIHAKVGKLR